MKKKNNGEKNAELMIMSIYLNCLI